MCLYLLWSGFSVGLRLAKTTGGRDKEGLCLLPLRSGLPSNLSAVAFKLAYRELHERQGETVRCAAAFCIARFLARSLSSDLSRLHSDYFFAQGMCLHLSQGRVSR